AAMNVSYPVGEGGRTDSPAVTSEKTVDIAQQFQNLLDRPAEIGTDLSVDPMVDDVLVDAATPMDTVGKLVGHAVEGVESMSSDSEGRVAEILETLSSLEGDLSASQATELMMAMIEFGHLAMRWEMLGKVVGQSTTGLQTLLRGE
ncbi:MAG: hypothetical protein ACR2RE_13355, partial [Geminicoccaceae bacterium]